MLGALAGDFVGSRFEFWPNKSRDFDLVSETCRPTDDTVLTIAVGDALAHGLDIAQTLRAYTMSYPASYGMHFRQWAYGQLGSDGPYGSWGNGAAMRVSTAAWLASSFEECMRYAEASAIVTHNHPQAVRSAKAVAAAIYAGLSGMDRLTIKAFIEKAFGYDLSMSVEDLMPSSYFELKSWISVQKAFVCAFEAETVEAAIRNAVYLGGDADTEAAIAASIAETWSEPPKDVVDAVMAYFPAPLRRRVESIQQKMRSVTREPLTVEEAMSLDLWDATELQRWIANNDEREAASTAQAEEEIQRQFARLNGHPTAEGASSPLRRLRRWLNWL
jgi:ADP-ribosylglycohydrolase